MKEYLGNVGSALSQLLNAVLWGDPKEPFSARLGREELRGNRGAKVLCKVISFVLRDPNHCIVVARRYENNKNK